MLLSTRLKIVLKIPPMTFHCAGLQAHLYVAAILLTTLPKIFSQPSPSAQPTLLCASNFEQCGGVNWGGPTCCPAGATCEYLNEFSSECIPHPSPAPTLTMSPTSPTMRPHVTPATIPPTSVNDHFECTLKISGDDSADDGDNDSTSHATDDVYKSVLPVDQWAEVRATFYLYALAGAALLVIYECGRGKKSVYSWRATKMRHRAPLRPGRWPLQWLSPVVLLDDDECRRMVGLDGFVCIRYLRWCLKVCLFCGFWGGCVLMPLYSTGRQDLGDGFARLTMANIVDRSDRLWAAGAFAALFNCYALYTLNQEWKLFVGWRHEFLVKGDPDAKGGQQLAYSVRVEALPKELRSDVALFAYFEGLFPGLVHSSVVHQDCAGLQRLIAVRLAECEKLEAALATRAANRRARLGVDFDSFRTFAVAAGGGAKGSGGASGSLGASSGHAPNSMSSSRVSQENDVEENAASGGDGDGEDFFADSDSPQEWLFCTRVPGCDGGTGGRRFHDFAAESADAVVDGNRGVVDDDDEDPHNNGACHGCAHRVDGVKLHRRRLQALNQEVAAMQAELNTRGDAIERDILERIAAKVNATVAFGLRATTGETGGGGGGEVEKDRPAGGDGGGEEGEELGWATSGSKFFVSTSGEAAAVAGAVAASAGGQVVKGALAGGTKAALDDLAVLTNLGVLGLATVTRGLRIITLGEGKSSTGYVTFKTKQATADARQVLLSNKSFQLEVMKAPDPRDIVWENASVTRTQGLARSFLASAAVWLFGIFTFTLILSFLQGLSNLSELDNLPGLKWLQRYTSADDDEYSERSYEYVFLTTQLPVLLQVVLMALLPVLFTALNNGYERSKSFSEVQSSVLARYYGFQLIQIYVTLLTGSLADRLKQLVQQPGCVFVFLGSSVPGMATTFAQLITIKALLGLPLELSRLWPFVRVAWFQGVQQNKASARTKRRLQEDTSEFMAGWIYPNFLFVISVCFTYSVIAPFIMLCGAVYFAVAYSVYKHQLLFVYIPKFETGGSLFPVLYGYTLTGMNFANVTMLGYMGLSQGWNQFTFLVPLVPLVEIFRFYTSKAYLRQSEVLSREGAVGVDTRGGGKGGGHGVQEEDGGEEGGGGGGGGGPSGGAAAAGAKKAAARSSVSSLLGLGGEGGRGDVGQGGSSLCLGATLLPSSSSSSSSPLLNEEVWSSFDPHLYRQPALDTKPLTPDPPAAEATRRQRRHRKRLARQEQQQQQQQAGVSEGTRGGNPLGRARQDGAGNNDDDDDEHGSESDSLSDSEEVGDGVGSIGGGQLVGVRPARLGSGPGVLMSGTTTQPLLDSQAGIPAYQSTEVQPGK